MSKVDCQYDECGAAEKSGCSDAGKLKSHSSLSSELKQAQPTLFSLLHLNLRLHLLHPGLDDLLWAEIFWVFPPPPTLHNDPHGVDLPSLHDGDQGAGHSRHTASTETPPGKSKKNSHSIGLIG